MCSLLTKMWVYASLNVSVCLLLFAQSIIGPAAQRNGRPNVLTTANRHVPHLFSEFLGIQRRRHHLPLISFRPTNKIMAITFAIDSEYNSQRAHFAQKMLLTFDNITKLVEEKGGCWKRPAAPKRERGVQFISEQICLFSKFKRHTSCSNFLNSFPNFNLFFYELKFMKGT